MGRGSAMKRLFTGFGGSIESEDRAKFHWPCRRKDSMQDPAMPNSLHGVALLSTTCSVRVPPRTRRGCQVPGVYSQTGPGRCEVPQF